MHIMSPLQVPNNERGRDIEGLKKVILVTKESSENVRHPAETWIVLHVLGNIGMVGTHDGYFVRARVLNHVQGCTIGAGNMNQRGLKLLQSCLNGGREPETQVIGDFWVGRIAHEGNSNRIVHEKNGSIRVLTVQVRIPRITALSREYAESMTSGQYLLLEFANR